LLAGSVEAKSYSGKNANERSEELKTIIKKNVSNEHDLEQHTKAHSK
jgi:hypothetical protein